MRSRMTGLIVAAAVGSLAAGTVFVLLGWWEAAVIVVVAAQSAILVVLAWLIPRLARKSDVRKTVTNASATLAASQRKDTARLMSTITEGFVATRSTTDAIAGSVASAATTLAAVEHAVVSAESTLSTIDSATSALEARLAAVESRLSSVDSTLSTTDGRRATFERQFKGKMLRQVNEVEGLFQLYLRETGAATMPLTGGWALDATSMAAALDAIERQRPDMVVELGSGTSTAWIAHLLDRLGSGRIISIDHDRDFAEVTRAAVERLGVTDRVDLRVVDLAPTGITDHDTAWYDLSTMDDIDRIDVLLVDGPPQRTGPMARYPAVPALFDRLSDGALILVDDAIRDDETTMIEKWAEAYPSLREEIVIPRSAMRILRKT